MGDMSSAWSYLPPLILVGGAFIVFMAMIGQEHRHADWAQRREPSSMLRWSVIALLFVASIAHVPVIPEHLHEAPYMGVLFICFTCAAFGLATVLAAVPARVWYAVAAALCTAAVAAYVATRVVAFPQLADDVGAWTEPLGLVSISAETAVVALSILALRQFPAPTLSEPVPGRR
jgi:xanthine/uracil/vitamin C permease (AzgA family)